jgi:putative oxidoreductase
MTATPAWLDRLLALSRLATRALEALQPAAQLAARVYVGLAFFRSGLTKIVDWDTTLALFHDEYHVPLLPPELAAWMGTAGELALPVLLIPGLFGRFAALGLSVVNAMAAASLPDIAPAALQQHVFWGSLLVGLALWGPGRWSVDALWWPRLAAPRPALRPATGRAAGTR